MIVSFVYQRREHFYYFNIQVIEFIENCFTYIAYIFADNQLCFEF